MKRVAIYTGIVLVWLAGFAFLASIKPAVAWLIRDWSLTAQSILLAGLLLPAVGYLIWHHLLQPSLRRRQERQQAGLGTGPIRQSPRD